jgi:hypothetical protein
VLKEAAPGSAVLYVEQPEPAPLHTDSLQPRELLAATNDVPPTAVVYDDEAG